MSKPSELAITLAALPMHGGPGGWVCADEVRGRLALLGFEVTAQQVGASLARMARTEAPWVERRKNPWGDWWEYRVTRYGLTDIDNRLPAIRVRAAEQPRPLCLGASA